MGSLGPAAEFTGFWDESSQHIAFAARVPPDGAVLACFSGCLFRTPGNPSWLGQSRNSRRDRTDGSGRRPVSPIPQRCDGQAQRIRVDGSDKRERLRTEIAGGRWGSDSDEPALHPGASHSTWRRNCRCGAWLHDGRAPLPFPCPLRAATSGKRPQAATQREGLNARRLRATRTRSATSRNPAQRPANDVFSAC
jgi:hypothetical protein